MGRQSAVLTSISKSAQKMVDQIITEDRQKQRAPK